MFLYCEHQQVAVNTLASDVPHYALRTSHLLFGYSGMCDFQNFPTPEEVTVHVPTTEQCLYCEYSTFVQIIIKFNGL